MKEKEKKLTKKKNEKRKKERKKERKKGVIKPCDFLTTPIGKWVQDGSNQRRQRERKQLRPLYDNHDDVK